MKKLALASLLGLITVCGISMGSEPAKSAWYDYTPVPHYQPYRGYYNDPTYIGQDYTYQNYACVASFGV
jgi:hypothetical protein